MNDNDILFEINGHLVYSPKVKEVILNHLKSRLDEMNALLRWEKIQEIYIGFMKTMPRLCKKKDPQSQSVYDCVALFAFYEAMEHNITLEEMEEMNNEVFIPSMKRVGFADFNKPFVAFVSRKIIAFTARRADKKLKDFPGYYHMVTEDAPKGTLRYRFDTCPIADFARKHHYEEIMPAFCNPDYPMLRAIGAELIRTDTCAKGEKCDYWFVGDKSDHLKEHPLRKDEKGFLYNE